MRPSEFDVCALTNDIGLFLAALSYARLPASALPLLRNAFGDRVGVIMVGIDDPVVAIMRQTLLGPDGKREARAVSGQYVSAPDARRESDAGSLDACPEEPGVSSFGFRNGSERN